MSKVAHETHWAGRLTSLRKSLGIIQSSEVIYSVLKPSLHFSCYYFFRTRRLAPSAEAVHFFGNVYFDKRILFDPVRHVCPPCICVLTLLCRNIDISRGCVWH